MSKTKTPPPSDFDMALLELPEVRAAIARDRERIGAIKVTADEAAELLGRRVRGGMSLRAVAEELGMPRAVRTIACGLHCGFPPCCVRFFVQAWNGMSEADRAAHRATFEVRGWNHQIPCPACVRIKRFVTPKPCDCGPRFLALASRAANRRTDKRTGTEARHRTPWEWPYNDPATMNSQEVLAAIARHRDAFGDIEITSAQAMALLGRRRTRIGDDESVTLRRVAQLLGERDVRTIACGLHSGFPPCCIRFFIETWSPMPRAERQQHREAIAATGVVPFYIPCRLCVRARRFVEMRRCDCPARLEAAIVDAAQRLRGH